MLDGESFRRLRLSRGLSLTDVAKVAGVTKNYVSMFENFKSSVNEDTYNKLLKAIYTLPDKRKEK